MKTWIGELLDTNIENLFDKDYVDFIIRLNDLNGDYSNTYLEVEEYIDYEQYENLYLVHMAGTAALDSIKESVKGKKSRVELISLIDNKKYRYASNKFRFLYEYSPEEWTVDGIIELGGLLSESRRSSSNSELRTIPKTYRGGKQLTEPSNIRNELSEIVSFLNSDLLDEYPIIKISMFFLAFIKISPFRYDNDFIGITMMSKLLDQYYGFPIFIETPLVKLEGNYDRFRKAVSRFIVKGEIESFVSLMKRTLITEIDANRNFLSLIEGEIIELNQHLKKTDIKEKYYSKLIRYLLINNNFKVSNLYERLGVKDKRTVMNMLDQLEKIGVIKNISDTRVKKYKVEDKFYNDMQLVYK